MTNRISQYFDDEPDRVTELAEIVRRLTRETARLLIKNEQDIARIHKQLDAIKGNRK